MISLFSSWFQPAPRATTPPVEPAASSLESATSISDPRWKIPGAELTDLLFDRVRRGDAEALATYLEDGYTPNAVNARGDSLLILAAYLGHEDLVEQLLRQPGILVNFRNRMGFTALAGAAFKGHTRIVERLAHAGAPVDRQDRAGRTALMFAALSGRLETVRLLMRLGAEPSKRDAQGTTALDLALQQGAHETASLLQSPARPSAPR